MVGAASPSEWHGTNWYVEQSGSQSWSGLVIAWYSDELGGHGRRHPYALAGPGQWEKGDSITLSPCEEHNREDSCLGMCGGQSGPCWCDQYCTHFGDCCSDYHTHCTRRELGEEENTEINGRRNLAEVSSSSPTESPTDLTVVGTEIEFDGMMFDMSFEPRILEAIYKKEHAAEDFPSHNSVEPLERRQLQSCPSVLVWHTYLPSVGDNGQYFFFDANLWTSMVGAASPSEWHGTNWYVEQSGSQSWSGLVIAWYSDELGGHGRRHPYALAGPGQWEKGDSITLSPCEEHNREDSCLGMCGGQSGPCWCDQYCTHFGDCCSDYHTHCTRRELGEEENTEVNGRRNLAETNGQGSAQRLLKML